MKQKIVLIIIGIITLAILGAGAWLLSKPAGVEIEKSDQAKVEVTEKNYDWGEIKINGGNAEKSFMI